MNTVIDRYTERLVEMYSRAHPNININQIRQSVGELIDSRLKNIPCVMHNNITHERIETNMIAVFEWVENRNPIISGNGTFFMQHEEYLSPTVKMLEKLQKKRKQVKKKMYEYPKESVTYVNLNVSQLSIKVIMNADYGGSGTPLSPFYSCYIPPATTGSAKNITTSLICCLELFSGNNNAWARLNNVNELFDMIFHVLEDTRTDRKLINAKYTVDEVAEWLLSKMNNPSRGDRNVVYMYLSTLSERELSKLMFAFNPRLILRKYVRHEVGIISKYLIENQLDLDNMTPESIIKAGYGVNPPEEIAELVENVSDIIVDNCVYPFIPNDCEVRANNMDRIIVCVTDTDSLMVQFASFIDDFQSYAGTFKENCLVASAFGMRLFIEHVIPTFVEYIAEFCNIKDKYYRDKFVFKNEFAFLAMALIAKKMYASSMFVQEGNPRDPHKIAVTGLSFKKRDAAEFLEPIMLNIYDKYILTGNKIDISGVLDEYYALRNKLLGVLDKNPSYYKVLSVKDVSAYEQSKTLPAQMRGSIVWNNIVPDEEILPMDRVYVIPLSFDLLDKYSSTDSNIGEILKLVSIDNPKRDIDPYICMPEHYHEIPEWISKVIDIEYATDKLLMPFKQLLDAFDVYVADTHAGIMPSRMVYI